MPLIWVQLKHLIINTILQAIMKLSCGGRYAKLEVKLPTSCSPARKPLH